MKWLAAIVMLGGVACGEVKNTVDAAVDPVTDSATVDASSDGATPDASSAVNLAITTAVTNYDVFVAAGSPTTPVMVTVTIGMTGSVGTATMMPAFTTGALPTGSTVTLINNGQIVGAGGAGGSGGNGGTGGTPTVCGRPGAAGGIAVRITAPTTITNNGLIAGGGGGGGGMSGCAVSAGGGGGAGSLVGPPGAGATTLTMAQEIAYCGQDNGLRTGVVGLAGTATTGGRGGIASTSDTGGRGGDLGRPGALGTACAGTTGPGGAAGFAIKRGNQTLTGVPDGTYATGTGPIRGPVGP